MDGVGIPVEMQDMVTECPSLRLMSDPELLLIVVLAPTAYVDY